VPPTEEIGPWAGDKYHGGFGPTQLLTMDYWSLRERSAELFRTNLYARGLLRRLLTNEINTGLTLEALPDESVLGVPEDSLSDWSEAVENRFNIWARDPDLCDFEGRRTFGEIQRQMRLEALISGDVLVVLDQSRMTGLPRVRIINGAHVCTPLQGIMDPLIREGVEHDSGGRQIAYWVQQADGTIKRVSAYGPRSGRRIAWLVYGTEKRLDDVRGEPILSLVLQSLKEIDRYRDSALRKAVLNSILAMFIQKDEAKPGTLPITGGAIRRNSVSTGDSTNAVRKFNITEHIPGMVIEELQVGERPVPHSTAGTDVNFGPFETAIIDAIAWANEIPPAILKLAFSSNYSASQGEINEFKMYLNKVRNILGESFLQPIYVEWLLSEILRGKVLSPGFLEAWRDPQQYDIWGAWTGSNWSGVVKPSTDALKQANGFAAMVKEGWMTNAQATKELNGSNWRKNIKKLRRENELKAEAMPVQVVEEPAGMPFEEPLEEDNVAIS